MPPTWITASILLADPSNFLRGNRRHGRGLLRHLPSPVERGRSELIRTLGLSYATVEEKGIYLPVREAHALSGASTVRPNYPHPYGTDRKNPRQPLLPVRNHKSRRDIAARPRHDPTRRGQRHRKPVRVRNGSLPCSISSDRLPRPCLSAQGPEPNSRPP